MIVDQVIAENSLNLMYAFRGLGKTWVGLYMAMCVALGIKFLSYRVPKPHNVLFIDGEMPLADLQARIKAIGAGEIDNFEVLSSELMHKNLHALNIANAEDRQVISSTLEQLSEQDRKPDFIIMDNLSSLRSGADENDNSDLDDILSWLISLRHQGYAVLLVHHAGKMGDQRGASRLEDPLDTTIKLTEAEPKGDGAAFKMEFTKTRGMKPRPDSLKLELVEDDGGLLKWNLDTIQKPKPQDNTLRLIFRGPADDGNHQFAKQQQLAEVTGMNKSAISKHLTHLRNRELVEKKALKVTEKGIARLTEIFPNEVFE